ncbi:Delta-aminolevulinic acid dehydratase [Chlamydiales bacterium SCGC AG-110-M15]|nr:Delta-aminolevulinic acid dehydratase [Chlamydiales bacterium SCGC AG-110-M15]
MQVRDTPMIRRPRRNRKSPAIRTLSQETRLHPSNFIVPLFILEGKNIKDPISSMPGIMRYSVDLLIKEAESLHRLGIPAVILFPIIPESKKSSDASEALRSGNLVERAVKALKKEIPELCVITDIALDPYTDHGHDGIMDKYGQILNDPTLDVLDKMALHHANAGADIVAPSDMMDGRVLSIRQTLDSHGFHNVNIMSYTAKYASAFYGPFRDALGSAPKSGDKKTYQMNPANVREAILEGLLDEDEGADFLMVKPALPYLDVISKIREQSTLPVGAYHVSGEYSMIMAAGERGWIDPKNAMYEALLSIKRAGADYILTYGSKLIIEML